MTFEQTLLLSMSVILLATLVYLCADCFDTFFLKYENAMTLVVSKSTDSYSHAPESVVVGRFGKMLNHGYIIHIEHFYVVLQPLSKTKTIEIEVSKKQYESLVEGQSFDVKMATKRFTQLPTIKMN